MKMKYSIELRKQRYVKTMHFIKNVKNDVIMVKSFLVKQKTLL